MNATVAPRKTSSERSRVFSGAEVIAGLVAEVIIVSVVFHG